MKRSASLILVELLIMLTVFALAAAICLRVFVWSDENSRQSAAADHALLRAQNVAETIKHYRGDFSLAAGDYGGQWDGASWKVSYDDGWNIRADGGAYVLQVVPVSCDTDYLGQARLTVTDQFGAVLSEFSVCWQEVEP